jgi:hypothetical protein
MSEVDEQIARSTELLNRTSDRYRAPGSRQREWRQESIGKRIGRIAIADIAILVAATVIGWFMPLGIGGALLVMLLLVAATFGLAVLPGAAMPEIRPETFHQTPLRILPLKTEQWLDRQRSDMPAQAARQVDGIGRRLETLGPQLAGLDENSPAAGEIRKLLADNLPGLVESYGRVPQPLRNVERNGKTPDQQLADGLAVIDREIAQMTEQLASGDLDLLATRGRYLQIKYQGDDAIEG